jgi:hypothetical protein
MLRQPVQDRLKVRCTKNLRWALTRVKSHLVVMNVPPTVEPINDSTLLLFEVVEQPIIEWALDYGITPAIIIGRLERGMSIKRKNAVVWISFGTLFEIHDGANVQTVREKFSCRERGKIAQSPAPFHVTPRGFAGPNPAQFRVEINSGQRFADTTTCRLSNTLSFRGSPHLTWSP